MLPRSLEYTLERIVGKALLLHEAVRGAGQGIFDPSCERQQGRQEKQGYVLAQLSALEVVGHQDIEVCHHPGKPLGRS